MNILALETCAEQGSIALLLNDRLTEARILPTGWNSSTIHGEIFRLLEVHGVATRDMDGFAVTNGPGSFTGVRVGLGVAKAFAEVHQKPILAVSTLMAIAASAYESLSSPRPEILIPILDARRGQVFSTVFRVSGESWSHLTDEAVLSPASALDLIPSAISEEPQERVAFCGVDLTPYARIIEASKWNNALQVESSPMLAGIVSNIALQLLRDGKGFSSETADANYVRRSDAELFWKEA